MVMDKPNTSLIQRTPTNYTFRGEHLKMYVSLATDLFCGPSAYLKCLSYWRQWASEKLPEPGSSRFGKFASLLSLTYSPFPFILTFYGTKLFSKINMLAIINIKQQIQNNFLCHLRIWKTLGYAGWSCFRRLKKFEMIISVSLATHRWQVEPSKSFSSIIRVCSQSIYQWCWWCGFCYWKAFYFSPNHLLSLLLSSNSLNSSKLPTWQLRDRPKQGTKTHWVGFQLLC